MERKEQVSWTWQSIFDKARTDKKKKTAHINIELKRLQVGLGTSKETSFQTESVVENNFTLFWQTLSSEQP